MNNDNNPQRRQVAPPSLPAAARLPINRCNLPPQILGSLTFQQHPQPLYIDAVRSLHQQLFQLLDALPDAHARAQRFMDYMVVQFRLHQLEDAGLSEGQGRGRLDYLRLLRGWQFNADGREAAVLKAWVESRFGLRPRYHQGALQGEDGACYQAYVAQRSEGLYATNALEAQLDLLYSYSQYELSRCYANEQRLLLYRGVNQLQGFELLQRDGREAIVLLNNLNAFSRTRARAEEFGDTIMEVAVPWQKCLYYSGLLPGLLFGEDEYLVIGGVYRVSSSYW